jgi:hemolysin D
VWVSNADVGFVRKGQAVKLKLAPYPFQKYGMLDGIVEHIGADSAEHGFESGQVPVAAPRSQPLAYKALVALKSMELEAKGERFPLAAGMQANAEILLGTRTVMEYLLSPVQGAWHEAGRER